MLFGFFSDEKGILFIGIILLMGCLFIFLLMLVFDDYIEQRAHDEPKHYCEHESTFHKDCCYDCDRINKEFLNYHLSSSGWGREGYEACYCLNDDNTTYELYNTRKVLP